MWRFKFPRPRVDFEPVLVGSADGAGPKSSVQSPAYLRYVWII